MVKAAS